MRDLNDAGFMQATLQKSNRKEPKKCQLSYAVGSCRGRSAQVPTNFTKSRTYVSCSGAQVTGYVSRDALSSEEDGQMKIGGDHDALYICISLELLDAAELSHSSRWQVARLLCRGNGVRDNRGRCM